MKKLFYIAIILLWASGSLATTYNVDCDAGGGEDYTTIQAAVNALADGNHTINIKGTCTENVSVAISGTGITTPLTFQNWNGNAVIDGSGDAGHGIEINNGEDYITIQASGGYSFTIQDFTLSGIRTQAAVIGNTTSFITVDGLTFANNNSSGANQGNFTCEDYCDSIIYQNNTSTDGHEHEIKCRNCDGTAANPVLITGNTVGSITTHGTSFGLYVINPNRANANYVEITNNTLIGTYTGDIRGIQVHGQDGERIWEVIVDGNYIQDATPGGAGNNGVGIQVNGVTNGVISDNHVENWDEDGIEVGGDGDSCYNVVVERNFLRNNNGRAEGPASNIEIASSSGAGGLPIIIRNNVIFIDNAAVADEVNGIGEHGTNNKEMEVYNNSCYVSIDAAGGDSHTCYRFDSQATASLIMKNNVGRSTNSVIFSTNGNTEGNTTSDYNSFYRTDNGNIASRAGTTYTAATYSGQEANHVASSPNFTNPAGLNLSLQAGDDRIDVGVDLSGIGAPAQFDDGLTGTSWANPTTTTRSDWDIGAYEFTGSPPDDEDDATECSNSVDDDDDDLIDCLDGSCDGTANCEYSVELTCDDDFDNDGDGNIDCVGESDCIYPPADNCAQRSLGAGGSQGHGGS